jgi:two-component system NtrC family sensor kinase
MARNVLIVDDSLTVRMDLADAFEGAGLRALVCSTIREARAAFSAQSIDLVILDVMLPDGDGVELLREIRVSAATRDLPVLMLSNEADVKDRIRGLQTGANDYVGKPYDVGHVVARGRELLRQRQQENQEPMLAEKPTILVIDDSVTFREELRGALELAGFAVVTATSGEKGLRLAAARRPTALIIDGVMPGMDGATVIRRLRLDAALRGLPCLLLTASEEQGAELKALDAGADAFVRKGEDMDVILARFTAMLRTARTEPEGGASFSGAKRILAVDDSPTYLHELAAALRDEGYDVVLARSGEEAIEMLGAQNVDCILLDLIMPGMGGQEACRLIKASATLRNIPLIMLTAVEDRKALIEGLGTGADDYVAKSNEFDVLRARIQAQVRRKQFEDENRRIRDQLLHKELEAAEARAARQLAEAKAELVEELKFKNKELEAFSYSISHDLRAPLRHVQGYVELFKREIGSIQLSEKAQQHLKTISDVSEEMGQLIDDLLAFSRMGQVALRTDRVDLDELVKDAVSGLEMAMHDRIIDWKIAPLPTVQGDLSALKQVFANLVGNAVKYTRTRERATIEIGCAGSEDGRRILFVRDNGVGFDMQYSHKLFGVFQRLHRAEEFEGTGIGLAIVRQVISRHEGRVWADAALDNGATIYFTLRPADEKPN